MSAIPSPPAAARGFTLLEVLVALVVVALGMSALLETLTQSARNVAALRDRTVAEWIAMNQVALARLSLNAPKIGVTQGDVQNCANGNWHWLQSVSAVDAIPGLTSITVSVRRTGNATNNSSSSRSTSRLSAGTGNNGAHPGATGQLGPNIALGPTASLGSITTLNTAGCASLVTPGSTLGSGSSSSPGQLAGPLGPAALSLGGSSGLAGGANAANSSLSPSFSSGSGSGASVGSRNSTGSTGSSGSTRSSSGTGQWLVTLTGFRGNTLGAPSGETPYWAGSGFAGQSGNSGSATSTPTSSTGGISNGLSGTAPLLGPQ